MSKTEPRLMRELPIAGYLDRLSGRPGEPLGVHVSVQREQPVRARLVRVKSSDPNPAGPGVVLEDLQHLFDREFPGRRKPIHRGSHARIERGPRRDPSAPCTWTCLVWSNLWQAPARVVLANGNHSTLLCLCAGSNGVEAALRSPAGSTEVSTKTPLSLRTWYRIWVSVNPATGQMAVGQIPVRDFDAGAAVGAVTGAQQTVPSVLPITIGAEGHGPARLHFNGKIEAPAIVTGFHTEWADPLALPRDATVLSSWDFSQAIDDVRIVDTGPQRCDGRLVNLPMRGVRGTRWDGTSHRWGDAPDHYAAIHFHEDDLNDCRWEADLTVSIPEGLPSGSYALILTCADGEDRLPFFVMPPAAGPHAPIAVLMSTFTYLAYANHERRNVDAAYHDRVRQWGAYPYPPDEYPIYGRSTYNLHPDGSGVAFSSMLRPMLNFRPGFMTYNDPKSSGMRNYPVDHYLLKWLEAKGFRFDVITDGDLHREGAALLAPYKMIITGSHPEYQTCETYDALMSYTRHGGRLAYLGGNGFYWRIALSGRIPGTIEVRRAEGGIRSWASEPGEYYHALDGQYGGLMQRNGRPPHGLVGVGFSTMGHYEASYYRRLPASHDPRVAWIFEGVDTDILGDYGLAAGGAAGYELDRAVPLYGTPDGTIVLARSENLPPSFMPDLEELRTPRHTTLNGEQPAEIVRGEMAYLDCPKGGAVFSVGSITFCGSLWKDGAWQGPISRILENVVRQFSST